MPNDKIHYCFKCSKQTEECDELPNGHLVWVCGDRPCLNELRYIAQQIEAEEREGALDAHY